MNIQQLRAQIAALQDATMDVNKNFRSAYDEGKFDALSAVDALLDSLQEEPVSEDLEEATKAWSNNDDNTGSCDYIGVTVCEYAFKAGAKWQKKRDYIPLSDDINEVARQICNKVLNCEIDYKEDDVVLSDEEECVKAGIRWQMQKESIPSKDLEELINSLSKRYPEMSFDKLSGIAVRVANWKEQQFEKNRLAACDRQTEEEAEREQDFVMGIIEHEHRQPTFDDAIKYGMRLQREQMMKDVMPCVLEWYDGFVLNFTEEQLNDVVTKNNINIGDKVKLIVIKED